MSFHQPGARARRGWNKRCIHFPHGQLHYRKKLRRQTGGGKPFDVGRTSDLDVAITSKDLLDKAKDMGIPLRGRGSRTGPLYPKDLKALGLNKLAQQLSKQVGRPVKFMLYESEEALKKRGQPYKPL